MDAAQFTVPYSHCTLDIRSASDWNLTTITAYHPTTGQRIGEQDTRQRWTRFSYDALGWVVQTIHNCTPMDGGAAAPAGQPPICGVLDHRADAAQGRFTTSDQNVPTFTRYDALGRMQTTVDAMGTVDQTDYDGMGRVAVRTANAVAGAGTTADTNITTRQAYDALGNMRTRTDPTGATVQYGFNGLQQTTVVTDSMGRITTFGYDSSGTLRWQRAPDGRVTMYQVDDMGRVVTTITNYQDGVVSANEPPDQDLTTSVVYDAAGRQRELRDAGGHVTRFAYDLRDQLTCVIDNAQPGVDCASAVADAHPDSNVATRYAYDRAGNRTAIIDAHGHTRTFAYDADDRRISETDALGQMTTFTYDEGGNRLTRADARGTAAALTSTYDG